MSVKYIYALPIAMLQARDSGMVGLLLNILPIATIVMVLYFPFTASGGSLGAIP